MNLEVNKLETVEIKNKIKIAYEQEFVSYVRIVHQDIKRFLDTHVGGFSCGAIMNNNKTLVTGGIDSVIRVWDLVQQIQLFTLHGHNSEVKCLTLSIDSNNIISGSFDASIRMWNFQRKAEVGIFKGHKSAVLALVYVERPHSVLSGDDGGELIVWDLTTQKIIHKLSNLGRVSSLILTLNKYNIIVGGSPDIVIYTFEKNELISTMKGHSRAVRSLSLTTDEKKMVSGSDDESIIIWDFDNKSIIMQLNGHSLAINSITLTSDNEFIVSGSDDKTLRIWSMKAGKQIKEFKHKAHINSILRANKKIISLSKDSQIGELDVESQKLQINWFLKPFNSDCIFNKSDTGLVAYGYYDEIGFWDLNTETEKNVLNGHKYAVNFVEISRDGKFAISCSYLSEKNLIYWNLQNSQKIAELLGHTKDVYCACFSNDGLTAASGSLDHTVRMWNLKEVKQKFELKGHTSPIYSIKFLEYYKFLASAQCLKIIIWNLENGTQHTVLSCQNNDIRKLLVTDYENFIISCDPYAGIEIWSVEQKRKELKFIHQKEAEIWLKENRIDANKVRRFLKA